ncbi:MAG: mechanosensitive ion channel [bacterium]
MTLKPGFLKRTWPWITAYVLALVLLAAPVAGQDRPAGEAVQNGSTALAEGETVQQPADDLPPEVISRDRLFPEADRATEKASLLIQEYSRPLPEIKERPDLKKKLSASQARILRRASFNALRLGELDLEIEEWQKKIDEINALIEELGDRIIAIQEAKSELARDRQTWEKTLEVYKDRGYESTLPEIEKVISTLDDSIAGLESMVTPLLSAQKKLSRQKSIIKDHLVFLQEKRDLLVGSMWKKHTASLFETGFSCLIEIDKSCREELAGRWSRYSSASVDYLQKVRVQLFVELLFLFLVWLGLRNLLTGLRERAEEIPSLDELQALFRHPLLIAILAAFLPASFFYAEAPFLVRKAYLLVLGLPAVILLISIITERGIKFFIVGIGVSYLIGIFRDIILGTPPLDRLMLLIQVGVALAVTLVTLSPGRLQEQALERGTESWYRYTRIIQWILVLLLGAGFFLQVFGLSRASIFLVHASFQSVLVTVLVVATYRLVRSLTVYFLFMPRLARIRMIRSQVLTIVAKASKWLMVAAIVVWIFALLRVWGFYRPVMGFLQEMWKAGFMLGETRISLGVVVLAFIALYISRKISRIICFVLDEQVYPRRQTEPGLQGAINQGLRYLLVFVGFVVALSILGVRLQNLAIIAGALGVGIGFGLQNVVNNFVSGIIMLAERPIKLGDVLELEGIWGTVRRIGMRATTIETWDKSEIIVPNGDLLWSNLINWTHNNRLNRIIIKVGVSYGSDPGKVMEILYNVAIEHPEIMTTPEPYTLFTGFGDSSLDFELRCYLPAVEGRLRVPSELRVEIYEALTEAGITIPFPQRDVYVKSVSWPENKQLNPKEDKPIKE